jgi:hypothetical protein
MLNHKQWINNNIKITKKHDKFYINNSSIYTNPLAYEKLSIHSHDLKAKDLKNQCSREFYWCPTGKISGLSEYK